MRVIEALLELVRPTGTIGVMSSGLGSVADWACIMSTIAARPFAGNPAGVTAPSEAIMQDHDLVALWEAHTRTEFETRDVDGTTATMVEQPYVNQIPTMTGGVGHDKLKRFYKYHLIGANPPDTSMKQSHGRDQQPGG